MSARVYLMKTVNDCKEVSIISLQDEQRRLTSLLFLYTVIFFFYNRMHYAVKHKQTNCKHSRRITASSVSITIKSKQYLKRQYRIRH